MLQLLELAAPQFSESEVREVQEFVDVGEYVLALETYVSIIEDEGKVADPQVEATVVQLADIMGIDSGEMIKKIRASQKENNNGPLVT